MLHITGTCRTSSGTSMGEDCVFPAQIEGETYSKRSMVWSIRPWCATKVDDNGVYTKWGFCLRDWVWAIAGTASRIFWNSVFFFVLFSLLFWFHLIIEYSRFEPRCASKLKRKGDYGIPSSSIVSQKASVDFLFCLQLLHKKIILF